MSYHLLNAQASLEADDFLIAGDGVYRLLRCFGMSIPFPLVLCEIRGLLPLLTPSDEAFDGPFAPSYHVLTDSAPPPLDTSRIYQYVIGREGVFLLAGCAGLEVLMPISAPSTLPGLAKVSPSIKWKYPLVSDKLVQDLFDLARATRDIDGHMLERLFYLTWEGGWHIHEPEQVQFATSVRATTWTEADEMAIIEGHSHHDMRAYFSSTDNQDELIHGGFKVYFVLGRVHAQPQIRTRVCVHGYSWEVPASTFFTLPADIEDCVEKQP